MKKQVIHFLYTFSLLSLLICCNNEDKNQNNNEEMTNRSSDEAGHSIEMIY